MASTGYELSPEADKDIEAIYDYSTAAFCADQAAAYLTRIHEICTALQDNPELGRTRPEIRAGLHSLPMENRIIFYRPLSPRVRIVRILHASRDLPKFFG